MISMRYCYSQALESVYIHSPVPIHLHSAPKYISHRRKPATSPTQAPHILRTSAISGILAAVEAAAYIVIYLQKTIRRHIDVEN